MLRPRRRNAEKAAPLEEQWGVTTHRTVEELVQAEGGPGSETLQFILVCVSSDANAAMLEQVASLGIPVLSQTPPAETLEDLTSMYQSLSAMGAKVQVCEQ